MLCGTAGTNATKGTLYVCPANGWYIPDPLLTFSKLFTRWRPEKICYEYVPRLGTGSDIAITWGFSEDPLYPETHSWTSSGNGYLPTEQQVGMLAGAVQFPAYIPQQCLDVKQKMIPWLYSTGADFNNPISNSDIVSDVRGQYCGVLVISGSENAAGTPSTTKALGAIYMEATFDFHELTASITADPSLMLARQLERECKREKEQKCYRSSSRERLGVIKGG